MGWDYVPPVWQGLLFILGCLVLAEVLFKATVGRGR